MTSMPGDLERTVSAYRDRFPGCDPVVAVRAPGRVNLIGEHLDYNEGLVLPIAIDRSVVAVAGRAADRSIHVFSVLQDAIAQFELDDDRLSAGTGWEAYAAGVVHGLLQAGITLTGTRVYVGGNLPCGVGLASSAAFTVAVAQALLGAHNRSLSARKLSQLCREAEQTYAGVPCGIMDHFACTMCRRQCALLIDCRTEHVEHIAWPDPELVPAVIDSGIERHLAAGGYARRVRECQEAEAHLRRCDPKVRSLRDIDLEQLAQWQAHLPATLWQRARHVVTEIQRTTRAVAALQQNDLPTLGALLDESHASVRDDFEVSLPALDHLQSVAGRVEGVLGCRLTGAGFGGSLVAVVQRAQLEALARAVRSFDARVIAAPPAPGVSQQQVSARE